MEKNTEQICFVHENWANDAFFNKHVCLQDEPFQKHDGKLYCLFHLPIDDKELSLFESAVNKRLEDIEKKEEAYSYDFSYVWFPPNTIDIFKCYTFKRRINFGGATFAYADFALSTFEGEANFNGAKFLLNSSFSGAHFVKPTSFVEAKFKKVDFSTSRFESDVTFTGAEFEGETQFFSSEFGGITLFDKACFKSGGSSFIRTKFLKETVFDEAEFGTGHGLTIYDSFSFSKANFEKEISFYKCKFLLQLNFAQTSFKGPADFRETEVRTSINFERASFDTYAWFSGADNDYHSWNKNGLNFSKVEIEEPEKIFFQTVQLKPDSFVKTDVRKFDFTDIHWQVKDFAWDWARLKDIIWWTEEARARRSGYRSLEKVYRRFASFAEENSDYQSASKFRYTAFDIQRITPWYGRLPLTLLWWYKWTSRYGENWLWCAILLLTLVFGIFPYTYTQTDFVTCSRDRPMATSLGICENKDPNINKGCTCGNDPITFNDAIVQSLTTATLQNVDYRRPMNVGGELWILLEKIFAPLQAALLALAIRRKFMR